LDATAIPQLFSFRSHATIEKVMFDFLVSYFVQSGAARSCALCGVVEGQYINTFIFIINLPFDYGLRAALRAYNIFPL
jgi:hypothetical protein